VKLTPLIRPLRVEDADAVGAVHVRAWQAAYRGLMPEDYLKSLTVAGRAALWAEALTNPPRPRRTRFGAEKDGRIVGFIVVGPADGDATTPLGEVYALNVDPDHWGCGIGQALLDAGVAYLREAGFSAAVLWVLPGNSRARRFYEAAGWRHDGASRRQEVLGVEMDETRYWRALASSSGEASVKAS
jgi:ribosomal protein S18 acetylase RimI-like enzyme